MSTSTAKGAVTAVKNRGWSRSCRASSTTRSFHSGRFVDMNVEVMFGEKQLAHRDIVNFACSDGSMDDEADYSVKNAFCAMDVDIYTSVEARVQSGATL